MVDASKFSGSTPFAQIKSLQLGQTIRSDLRSITELPPQVPAHIDSNPIDLLTQKLSDTARQFDSVYLSFSGGLDSSVIFYCLKQAGVPFTPFHGVSTIPYSENELAYATDVASHFGVTLQLRSIESKHEQFSFEPSAFTRIKYPTPFAVDIFARAPAETVDSRTCQPEPIRRLYLTGQGGDHVFLQNPGWNVGIDELLRLRIGKSLSQISNYCRLKGDNLFRLLYRTARLAMHKQSYQKLLIHTPSWMSPRQKSQSGEWHYLLKHTDPRSAKYRHVSTILAGLSGISLDRNTDHSTLHPLFLPDLIGTVLHRPIAELYTSEYDRIVLRNAAHQASGHSFAWRQTKRSSASDYFSYFRNHLSAITRWLESGLLVKSLDIDFSKLRQSLEFNGNLYLNQDFSALINLIQLEAYIQSMLHFSSALRDSHEE
ncbi:asparagine synthase-related protein [Achromobacter aegrifaciens]|uniref:asparagine synthase-related protein n=1 Tax=Achromobacter aegrifaciens TaxID=1287736 RepID=UPI0032084C8F